MRTNARPACRAGCIVGLPQSEGMTVEQAKQVPRPVTWGVGWAGRPRTVALPIMSRFPAVHRMAAGVMLAGQVRFPVRLDASSLGSCPWWNDQGNDCETAGGSVL